MPAGIMKLGNSRSGFNSCGLILAATLLVASSIGMAKAQEGGGLTGFATDPDAPVQIESDTLEVYDKEHVAIFIGNVLTTQGETKMRSDRLKANYAPAPASSGQEEAPSGAAPSSKIKDIYASGNVHILSKDDQSADGEWAHYTVSSRKIVMGDRVVLRQNKNVVKGTKLFIDLNTGLSRIVGGAQSEAQTAGAPSKGRVRALFESPPKDQQ